MDLTADILESLCDRITVMNGRQLDIRTRSKNSSELVCSLFKYYIAVSGFTVNYDVSSCGKCIF